MRKDLLPREGRFYKANLHAHSTVSDGHYTPEELKQKANADDFESAFIAIVKEGRV